MKVVSAPTDIKLKNGNVNLSVHDYPGSGPSIPALTPRSSVVRTLERLRSSQLENARRHAAIESLRAARADQ